MRRRPLYEAAAAAVRARDPNGHAGLWFDKFCDRWTVGDDGWEMSAGTGGSNPKLEWIRTVANGPVGSPKQMEEYSHRLMRLVRARGGGFAVFEMESRFVTGLGRSHPVENGFAWHPVLGTPFLPGSSVKGLVRSWAELEAEPRPDPRRTDRVFGPRRGSESTRGVGALCFLDAVPVGPVRLDADVMTPHYANWSADDPPGDWRSPVPIPFLTTAAETRFLFGVIPGRAAAQGDLDSVFGWLEAALNWAGAGGKTAVGYGRFRRDEDATTSLTERLDDEDRRRHEERDRAAAMKSPMGRWRLKLTGMSETLVLEEVRLGLERGEVQDPEERLGLAEAVAALGFVQHWSKGMAKTKTNVGAKKLKQRARLVRAVTDLPDR